MPDLKLKVNEMETSRTQSVTDHIKKFDTTPINGITSNGVKCDQSKNDIKSALNKMLADTEADPMDKDRSGKFLPSYHSRLKKCIGNEKFMELYMQLSIEEQKSWMAEEYKNVCPHLPENLIRMLPGAFYPGDCGRSNTEKPDWLDMEKFRKGQQFVKDNYVTSWLSMIYGFYAIYNMDDAFLPLQMGNNNHTPYKTFRRYLSTMTRMDELYFGDPWTEGTAAYKNVQYIRRQHLAVRQKLCKYDNETIYNMCVLKNPYAPGYDTIRKDIDTYLPTPAPGQCPFNLWESTEPSKPKSMSQIAMAVTQHGFVGFIITKPEMLGVANATDENLEAFCHMWRGIGYLLGIKDEFNFCNGSLEEIKERARNINEYWLRPCFQYYSKEIEHTTRALYDGLNYFLLVLDFNTLTLQVSKILNIEMPNLYASMSYPTWFFYKSFNILTRYLTTISFIRKSVNMFFMYLKKRANAFDANKLAELREKSNRSVLSIPIGQSLVTP